MPQFQAGALPRRKAKRPKPAGEGKAEATALADSDVEEADIAALARASLKEGEVILGEGSGQQGGLVDLEVADKRGICNAPALLQKLSDIEYKVPEGAKRVPWVDTLAIEDQQTLPSDVKSKDGVKLESMFVGLATNAVKEAYRRLKVRPGPNHRSDAL
ncbi:unnamed protein product [Prorocentrum cordatum]|uniref:Uncharacterized protein n=1 Tax=Prorocentrum cordatum TaxID=2364126 RepID=A0ABN9U2C0_9DINO|nr:unnamed protein product [Polarella glacialis]